MDDTLGLGHPEPVETYSTSEHLYSALRIPAGITGTLPTAMRGRLGLGGGGLEDIGGAGRKRPHTGSGAQELAPPGIGRAAGRGKVEDPVGAGSFKKKKRR